MGSCKWSPFFLVLTSMKVSHMKLLEVFLVRVHGSKHAVMNSEQCSCQSIFSDLMNMLHFLVLQWLTYRYGWQNVPANAHIHTELIGCG
jgi:hypothetical protein